MGISEQSIHFANATLGSERHICAFFHSSDEEYRILLPFIREGIERGEKAFHIVDPRTMEDHFRRLREAGIEIPNPQRDLHIRSGVLQVERVETEHDDVRRSPTPHSQN